MSFNLPALAFALGNHRLCLIAWGYLVYLAIDFGTSARAGDSGAWGLLALSSLGAVACLLGGPALVVSRLLRALGLSSRGGGRSPTGGAHPSGTPDAGRGAAGLLVSGCGRTSPCTSAIWSGDTVEGDARETVTFALPTGLLHVAWHLPDQGRLAGLGRRAAAGA